MKYLKLIFNRLFVFGLMILVQVVYMLLILNKFSHYSQVLSLIHISSNNKAPFSKNLTLPFNKGVISFKVSSLKLWKGLDLAKAFIILSTINPPV